LFLLLVFGAQRAGQCHHHHLDTSDFFFFFFSFSAAPLTHPLSQPQRGLPPPHSPFFFLGVCAGVLTLLQWFV
jgi:drug/metabolite transporter (DMT)-like permease